MPYMIAVSLEMSDEPKIEHSCAKICCFPFFLACYFCANKKRNKYDEKDWKIKRMADVTGWLCDGDNLL